MEGRRLGPKAGHLTDTFPAARGGFRLKLDAVAPIVHVKLWGFWDVETAERFRAELLAQGDRLGAQSWSALVDSRLFLAQTPEVTQHRGETMVMIMGKGCRRIAAVVAEAGTYAMQFTRIASEAGVANAVFVDPAIALKWIRES